MLEGLHIPSGLRMPPNLTRWCGRYGWRKVHLGCSAQFAATVTQIRSIKWIDDSFFSFWPPIHS